MTEVKISILDYTLNCLHKEIHSKIINIPAYSNEYLYHYTTSNGLLKILKSKNIWCSHTQYLNDNSEITYALDIINEVILEYSENCKSDLFKNILQNNLENIHLQYDSYITSLTEEGNLLSQWRAYGEGGNGYSIGFSLPEITNLRTINDTKTEVVIRKVEYEIAMQKQIIVDLLDIVFSNFKNFIESGEDIEENEIIFQFSNHISWYLADIMLWFKHPAFSEEKEWRLIQLVDPINSDVSYIDCRIGFDKLIPYIKLANFNNDNEIITLPIETIITGPTLEPNLTHKSLTLLLKKYSLENVIIKSSGIPLCK